MWNIILYTKENGSIPAAEFLGTLPAKHHAKALRDIDILERYGRALTEPHTKHVGCKLWELRVKSASDISSIFYFIHVGDDIVLLHGFIKKTQKAPKREMETASRYMDDYIRRHQP